MFCDGLSRMGVVFLSGAARLVHFPSIRIQMRVPPAKFDFVHFAFSGSISLVATNSATGKHVATPRIQRNSKIESKGRSTKIFQNLDPMSDSSFILSYMCRIFVEHQQNWVPRSEKTNWLDRWIVF